MRKATKAELRQEIDELRNVGQLMSNLCFNQAQHGNLDVDLRRDMNNLRRQWDAIKRREKPNAD